MNRYCVIGEKLTHTMSPQIHKAYFDYYKRQGEYEVLQIPMSDMDGGCKELLLRYDGFNVTVPYKEKVIKYLDGLSQEAKNIKAVNTVVNSDGKLYGYNTDPYGFGELLRVNGVEIAGKSFVVLGSGGASKSVCYVLKKAGAKTVKIATRDSEKCKNDKYISYCDLANYKADAVVNTTPVGMFPNVDASPLKDEEIANFQTVVDIVYNPMYTKLLQSAVRLGKKAVGGLYMLVAQAVKSQEIWSNSSASRTVTKEIYNKLAKQYYLQNGGNIYLTGIMSCGKTVKGKRAARELGWKFVDTDEYVEKISGKSVKQLFDEGEEVFRDWESKAIYELSQQKNLVVATGGGAILRDRNVSAMKLSGIIVMIERKIEDIIASVRTDTRPLLKDGAEKLRAIYEKRKDRYYSACDKVVKSFENDVYKTVKEIVKIIK